MKPKPQRATKEQPLIGWRLDMVLDPQQDLFRLAAMIDWALLEKEFGTLYCADNGRPGVPIRLMTGLHLLKHAYGLSDEEVAQDGCRTLTTNTFAVRNSFSTSFRSTPAR